MITLRDGITRDTGLLGACVGDSGGDDIGAHDDDEASTEAVSSSDVILLPDMERTITADDDGLATVDRRSASPRRGWVTI